MTRDLFLALGAFRERHCQLESNRWLRINVPVNLRRPEHAQTPAANIVSMIFLCRKPRMFGDRSRLLRSIHGEMSRIKRFDVKYAYLNFSQVLHWLPRGYDIVMMSRKCHATAVFTNLGRILGGTPLTQETNEKGEPQLLVGDLRLVDVDLTAPLRPLCNVAFALTEFGGRQTVTLHYDHHVMTPPQGEELIDEFVERLNTSANEFGAIA